MGGREGGLEPRIGESLRVYEALGGGVEGVLYVAGDGGFGRGGGEVSREGVCQGMI